MRLYPAIDLKDGKCVRLVQGDYEAVTVFNEDPVAVARLWEEAGASYLHLVDLDGAKEGKSMNDEVIRRIVEVLHIPVQVGGGIRTLADIEVKLKCGVKRVILGSVAVRNPELVSEAIQIFGAETIVVGIDAKEGKVAIEGWLELTQIEAVTFAQEMSKRGVQTIIYTDIAKDGMMQGPNQEMTHRLVEETSLNIIASGGVSSEEDLRQLKALEVEGAIIGKALYLGAIDLKEAIQTFERV